MSGPSVCSDVDILKKLRRFLFPSGEAAARHVRAVRTIERGEIRMSPESRWIPFAASQFVDSTQSNFRWEARLDPGKLTSPTVIDAYGNGRGFLEVKLGGILTVKKIAGRDADKGELQRYLASLFFCPAMLLNHPTLEWITIEGVTLRLRERQDLTGAIVNLELSEEGRPIAVHAIRPRVVGKRTVLTPWQGVASEWRDLEEFRIVTHFEVAWELEDAEFTYYRSTIESCEILR